MKNFLVNWKTTSAGILALLGAGYGFYSAIKTNTLDQGTFMALSTAVLSGIGLLFAKDGNVTGGATASTPEAAERIAK